MLREIKNHLFNKKIGLIFFCFFILFGLLFPLNKAKAIIGTGIFDFFETALGGIEEKAAPLAKQIIMVFVTYVVGLVALYTSSNLLDLAIREQSNWLTIQSSPIVQSGWRFTSGLANLFLILIFVAIAIAYILKIETFQAKKALPKLIIVALLLNFSLVFIGALVDISNIFYNTILRGNEGLATQFIGTLGAGGWDVVWNLTLWIALLAGLWIIPFIGPFAQLGFVLLVVGVGFLPNIMTWVFQIVLFLMISGVFFLWTFLFAVRVFLIQILAILAPLAFVCLILPQTRKYWDDWLKHLLSWTFLGIFLLFFLAIGLRAANTLVPPGGLTPIPFLDWGQVTAYFTYYFFLFIYLILVAYVSSRFMPALATFMISQAKSWGGVAWGRAIKPFGKVFTKSAERVGKEKVAPWLRGKIGEERVKKWTMAPLPGAEERGVKAAFKRLVSAPTWGLRKVVGKTLGPARIEAEKIRMGKAKAEAEKVKEPTLLLSRIRDAIGTGELATAIGLLTKAIEKGGGFKKLVKKEITDGEAVLLGQYANRIKAVPEAERIGRLFAHKKEVVGRMGFKKYEELEKGEKAEWDAKGYKTIQDKLIGETKGDKVKDFAKNFWTDRAAMEAVQKFWGGPQLGRAAAEFGREFVGDYAKVVEKLTPEQFVKINPRAFLYLSGNAAQDLGLRSVGGLERKEVGRKIKEAREEIPPVKMPAEEELEPLRKAIREVLPESPPVAPPAAPPSVPPTPAPRRPPGRPGRGPAPRTGRPPRRPPGRS